MVVVISTCFLFIQGPTAADDDDDVDDEFDEFVSNFVDGDGGEK